MAGAKKVKTRKPHGCRVCGGTLAAGLVWDSFTGFVGGPFTIYFHSECWTYSDNFTEGDWEFSAGDFSYEEVCYAVNFMKRLTRRSTVISDLNQLMNIRSQVEDLEQMAHARPELFEMVVDSETLDTVAESITAERDKMANALENQR